MCAHHQIRCPSWCRGPRSWAPSCHRRPWPATDDLPHCWYLLPTYLHVLVRFLSQETGINHSTRNGGLFRMGEVRVFQSKNSNVVDDVIKRFRLVLDLFTRWQGGPKFLAPHFWSTDPALKSQDTWWPHTIGLKRHENESFTYPSSPHIKHT